MDLKQSLSAQPSLVLSLLLLSLVGCIVLLATGGAVVHDRAVSVADERCFQRGLEARRARVATRLGALEREGDAEREAELAEWGARLASAGPSPDDVALYAELDGRNELSNAQMAVYMVLDPLCAGKDDGLKRQCNVDAAGLSKRKWLGGTPKWALVLLCAPGPLLLAWTLASRRWRLKPA